MESKHSGMYHRDVLLGPVPPTNEFPKHVKLEIVWLLCDGFDCKGHLGIFWAISMKSVFKKMNCWTFCVLPKGHRKEIH
jgi:hypothetical protein